jgi:predicted PurR-regulated permease PerM
LLVQEQVVDDKTHFTRAREVFIRMSLIAFMAITCYLILKPFLMLILWGVILAIAAYPAHRRLTNALAGRERLSALLCTAILLMLVIIPAVLLAGTLANSAYSIAVRFKDGSLSIPPPPARIDNWPLVGLPLKNVWTLASTNLSAVISPLAPHLREQAQNLLSASAAIGATLFQFILSILLAGFLLANCKTTVTLTHSIFDRVFGDQGREYEDVTESTIRSVTNGILGVAVIQSVFAGIGFVVVGLPGAGMWAAMFLVASVLQIGPLILIPAAIYAFLITSTSHAAIFLVWCVVVGLMDNVLKPLLLGRGSKVPTAVIFVGVVGGFIAIGIVGLFVGAIILAVGYKLFLAWLNNEESKPMEVAAGLG